MRLLIENNLGEVTGEMRKRIDHWLDVTLWKLANDIRETTQDLAPVDTGRLEQSYKVKKLTRTSGTLRGYTVETNVPYAPYQEFGFWQRNGVWNPGNPHLGPAAIQHAPQLRSLQLSLQRAIDAGGA